MLFKLKWALLKVVVYKSWHETGVKKVKHLRSNSGKLLIYQEFIKQFEVKISFTQYILRPSQCNQKQMEKTVNTIDRGKHEIKTGMTPKKIFLTLFCKR